MKAISRPNQYLQQRGEVWYYIRRVPAILTEKIGRRIISRSLETDSVSMARRRRDMCADADNARWQKLIPSTLPDYEQNMRDFLRDVLDAYERAGESELAYDKLGDFLRIRFGGISDAKEVLGDVSLIRSSFANLQKDIYAGQ